MLTDDDKKQRIRTINERLQEDPKAAREQCERLRHHLEKMDKKAKVRGWGKSPKKWPGNAPFVHADITFYVATFDHLAAPYE